MKSTGVFVTKEELEHVLSAYKASGMWTSDGTALGDPGYEVKRLEEKYHPPKGSGLNTKTGEFMLP